LEVRGKSGRYRRRWFKSGQIACIGFSQAHMMDMKIMKDMKKNSFLK